MSEYLRFYQSAVDPADVEEVKRLFIDDVRPVFVKRAGCMSIELTINTEENAGGLVEGVAISRWESRTDMEAALASREVREALVRVRQLLRQEPVQRVFEVIA